MTDFWYRNHQQQLQKQEDILKGLREKYGFTQQEVADSLFVSRQTYSSWERGRSEIPFFRFLQLAVCYDISVEELMEALF